MLASVGLPFLGFFLRLFVFTLCLSSPSQCGSFSEDGERKKNPSVFSWASPSPNPTPSLLQTRQQTGPLCQPPASGPLSPQEAGTSRHAVRQVFRDARGLPSQGRRRLSAKGSGLGGSPGSPHSGTGPGSSHPGSLATFPKESPKGSECGYLRALDLLCRETRSSGPGGLSSLAALAEWRGACGEDALAG